MRDRSQKKDYFSADSCLAKEKVALSPCKINPRPKYSQSKRDKKEKLAYSKSRIYYSYRAAKKHINSL